VNDVLKPVTFDGETRVADIVAEHPECARVLKEHRIDFCCQGQQTLAAACARLALPLDGVLETLTEATEERTAGARAEDPRGLSIPALIALIISRHHGWLRESLPWIRSMADKVSRVHGPHDPRLIELGEVVGTLADTLLPHLDDEERDLFPALMSRKTQRAAIEEGLVAMESEHRVVGGLLERTRTLTEDFTPPDWACGTYRALLAELEHLEDDVLRHVHLENHVLAAKARDPGAQSM
jgi:regulator of cell morphogenesis and NO signaling